MPSVRLSLFGGFGLWVAGRDVALPKKTQALLAYVALNPNRPITRERLAGLLWDDAPDALGRSSLRQALSGLRKELSASGHDASWTEADAISIGADVTSDVAEFRRVSQLSAASELRQACSLYAGDLLLGFHARSLQFDNWLQLEREHLRREVLGVVQRWSELTLAARDEAQTLEALRRWIALDPVDERPRRKLMECLAAAGRSAQALEEYRALRETLRRELGMNPEPATEELHAQIRRSRATPVAAASAPAPEALPPTAAIASDVLRVVTVALVRLELLSSGNLDAEDEASIALDLEALVKRSALPEASVVLAPNHDVVVTWGTHRGNEAEVALRTAFAVLNALNEAPWPAWARSSARIAVAQGSALLANGQYTGRAAAVVSELVTHARAGQVVAHASIALALAGQLMGTPLSAASGAWLVTGLSDPNESETTPFIGRASELALLSSQLEACIEQHRCGVVLVRAEAGMGKSRLLGALRTRALTLGADCHVARALDFGQSSNSRLLAALTLSLAGLALEADAEARFERLQSIANDDRDLNGQLVHLLELVGASIPRTLLPLQKALDPAARAAGRRAALSGLLRFVSSGAPVLVQLEDMHWSSPEERSLVAEIVVDSQLLPVLFVLSTRIAGDHLDAQWRAALQGSLVSTLELGPLPLADARQFAGLHSTLPETLVESCIERAQGLPLFLDQLLRAAASGQTQLPGSVRASVVGRLDVLAPTERALVYAAAVLGQRGPVQALYFLAARDEPSPESIVGTGLLVQRREEWSFRHALFRDAVYDSLLKATRASLHLRAADWYRQRDVVLYADHLAAAGDAGAAQAYLDATELEARAQRNTQALYCAQRARELASDPQTAATAACAMGNLQLSAGATHAALNAFRQAVELAATPRATAEAWLGVAAVLRVLDRQTEALDALQRASQGLPSDEPLMFCKWWTLRGNVMFSLDFEACREAHERALQFARLAGSELDEVLAVGGLGDAYYQRGLMLTAHDYFVRCVEQCRQIGSLASLLAYLPMSAITSLYQADFAGAEQQSKEALLLAERIGSPRAALLAEVAAAALHLGRAEYELAEKHAQQSLALSKRIGAGRFEAEAQGMVGVAYYGLGRTTDAVTSLRRARELAIGAHSAYAGPFVLGHLARATTDPAEREQALSEGERLLEVGAVGSNAMEFFMAAIDLNLRLGDFKRALQLADRLEESTRAEPLTWSQLAVRRARTFAELSGSDDVERQHGIERFNAEVERIGFLSLRLPPAQPSPMSQG